MLGAGYILIEVALIQKFVLFLGHPTYALTVIIFSMLVSSGLGSFASRQRVAGIDDGGWSAALVASRCWWRLLALIVSVLLPRRCGCRCRWKIVDDAWC